MADGTKPPGLVGWLYSLSFLLCNCKAINWLCLLQLQTGVNIVKNEGFLALYSGLGPAIGRGLFYGGQSQLIRLP